jgi:hypothetical protein
LHRIRIIPASILCGTTLTQTIRIVLLIFSSDGQQPEGAAIEDDSFNTFFTETGEFPFHFVCSVHRHYTLRIAQSQRPTIAMMVF